jgi:MFS family permease
MTTTDTPVRSRRPLFAFLAANVVSITGTRISAIAIPWFVLTTTGSPMKTGLVTVFEMTPLVVMKGLGGPLIDRLGPRRVSVVGDVVSAVVVGLVPLLHWMGLLSLPVLLALVAVAGAARGPADTAKGTLVPDIARIAGTPVERVTGLESSTDRTATIIGPAVAGVIIAAVGSANALLLDAVSFAVCAALIGAFAPARQASAHDEEEVGGYWQRLRSGFDFLAHEPLMRGVTVMICLTNLLDIAFMSVLLPVWIKSQGYGPTELGLAGSAFGLTATAGALLAAGVGERLPRRLVYLVGFTVCGAPRFVAMALDSPMWLLLVVLGVGGFGAGFINPILGAIYIDRTPPHLLGRVLAMSESLAWAGMPVGGVLAGFAIAGIGLAPALLVAGSAYFLATTVPGLLPQWKDMDRRTGTDPAAGAGAAPVAVSAADVDRIAH